MQTPRKIAVAGATGRVGRHVVDVLTERGHNVVPMSRASGVDIITGDGLAAALAGVACIIDAASGPSPEQDAATAFFTTAARHLREAGRRAGVRQMVVVSIIGADRFTTGYTAAKLAHEEALRSGSIPVEVVRAAQFHEFVGQFMDWRTEDDVAYLPEMRTQLVAARTVAEVLADVAIAALSGSRPASGATVVEVAGPREESLVRVGALLAARRGHPAKVEGVSDPSNRTDQLYLSGGLLPGADAILGGPTFEEWLDDQVPAHSAGGRSTNAASRAGARAQ